MKKISELDTKTFLGASGAAENSYVLINYEDSTTNEPVTYKATIQELGKAIANDLKLPSVTVSEGAITNFKVKGVSNGAYTETVVEAPQNDGDGGMSVFESIMIPAETAGDPSISTYVVTTDEDKFYITNNSNATPVFTTYHKPVIVYDSSSDGPFGYYESYSSEIHYIPVPSMGDVSDAVDTAISGLATSEYVTIQIETATSLLASTGYVDSATNGLASTGYVDSAVNGLASTGYVDYAISGLASTGYVTDAVANAGGGFDPTESISCPVGHNTMNGSFVLDRTGASLYPVMVMLDSDNYLYVKSSHGDGLYNLGGIITAADLANINNLAYISTSDTKPCIRDYQDTFQGFLSTT